MGGMGGRRGGMGGWGGGGGARKREKMLEAVGSIYYLFNDLVFFFRFVYCSDTI